MLHGLRSSASGIALIQLLLILVSLVLVAGVGYLLLTDKWVAELAATAEQPPVDDVRQSLPPSMAVQSNAVASSAPAQTVSSGQAEGQSGTVKGPASPSASPTRPKAVSLPRLNQSDSAFRSALVQLDPTRALAGWLIDEEMIRKLVVTIDNMADGKLPRKHSLLLPISSKFRASEKDGQIWLDGYSHGRYRPYVELLSAIGSQQWIALYRRYYPLMQQAYAELGYPNKAFHDRVLLALDHLLQSPVISRPLVLDQPSVMYRFADPELEQLSAVHKQMLRVGPVNARKIMDRLTVLRAGVARLPLALR